MVVSSRAVVAMALALTGVAALGLRASAQQADTAVRKTATPAGAPAAAKPAPPVPAVFGTVDIEAVFKKYDKVKAQQEEFKAAATAKHKELLELQNEAQAEAAKLPKLTPGSIDAKKIEDHLIQLKAQLEAGREQAQRDFAVKESEMLATLYKEVQTMVGRIAAYRGMTYVVQVSNDPIDGNNPNSVMAAMAKTVVYADPRNDITTLVAHYLNQDYQAAGGVKPKAAAATPSGN